MEAGWRERMVKMGLGVGMVALVLVVEWIPMEEMKAEEEEEEAE